MKSVLCAFAGFAAIVAATVLCEVACMFAAWVFVRFFGGNEK